jgi:hypothetical protein
MVKKKNNNQNKKPRIRKQPSYKSFRLSKKIKPAAKKPLPGIFSLCKISIAPFKKNKKLFLGIILIHFIFTVIFVSGIGSTTDFVQVKNDLEEAFGADLSKAASAVTLFSYALSSGSGTGGSANYQMFISLIVSLAIIWSIRQTLAGEKIGVRQAFYQGIYPLVPFMAVLLVIGLQFIPALIGNFLLVTVISGGLAVTVLEQALWWLIFIMLLTLSLYMVLSSIFALYISTLPDMTPMRALRSARGLVMHRRIHIALRLIGLPVVILIIYGLILMPLIFTMPILVVPVILLLGSFSLFFMHSYLYNLYRALL